MTFLPLLRDIWSVVGTRYALYLLTMMLAGLAEGLALASVVPLLSAVGVGDVEREANGGMLAEMSLTILGILDITPTLNTIAGFVVCALVVSTILFLVQAYMGVRLQTDYVYASQSRLIDAIFSARLQFLQGRRQGDIVNAVVTETQRLGGAFYQLGLLLTGVVHGLIYLAIAASLSVAVTLAVLGGGAFLLLITRPLVHRAYRIGAGISAAGADLQTMATDFVSGAKVLKATATEHQAAALLRKVADRMRRHFFSNSFDIQIAKGIFDFGAAAMVAGILFGGYLLLGSDPAITLVVLAIFVRLMPKLSGIQQSLQTLSLSVPAVKLVNEMASSAEAEVESRFEAALPASLAESAFDVRLRGVTVKRGDLVALRKVDLTVPAGSCVALVGASGAGKSTLVDAVLGLVPLAEGTVEVNGHSLATLPLGELRRRIGYMSQDPVLFHGTVRENILWGQANGSDRRALEALRMAAASGLVERLPQGLDTVIGNRGASLSGGERQRLGLARALAGDPGLLVLDEATSALDADTEAVVTEALRQIKGKVTILMIAHRLSSVRLADEIHVLEQGAIVESGTWAQLTQNESRFARLWRLQTESGEEKCLS